VINLMPAEMKEQIRYAKLNRLVLRYVRFTVVVVLVLGGIFVWSILQVQEKSAQVTKSVADKQQTLAEKKKAVLPKAQDASDRLAAIKYVQQNQTHFSLLIADLAKVVPDGVSIDGMTLTGSDKQNVRITVSALTYDQVLAFRNSLITSPRIAGADIESIQQVSPPQDGYNFIGSVVVGFKPGQAK
jgi:Tfp pilus assembly protein PilN